MAGYEDVNDAERLSQDPTFRLIGSEKIWKRLAGLAAIHRELIAKAETIDSPQRVVLDMDSSEGDCLAAKLRPGNFHSADDWEELLLPEGPEGAPRQQKLCKQVVFRADAAFAKPEIYEALEERGVKYAIRIPSNDNLETDSRAVVRFYNKRGTAEQWIKEGKQAVKMTRLSCRLFRSNEVRLLLNLIAYKLGNLWRRLVKTGGRLIQHARYYWLLLAESRLTRRLFGSMARRIAEEAELARSWAAGVAQDRKDIEKCSHGGGWGYNRGRPGSQNGNPG
jgi:hypothetical protein